MSTEAEPQPAPEPPAGADPHLQILVAFAERGLSQGITLMVGGLVMTGQLASGADYFRHRAAYFGPAMRAALGNETADAWQESNASVADRLDTAAQEPIDPAKPLPDRYLHLRNVRFLAGNGQMVGAINHEAWWRGKIAAVDGFVLGEFGEVPQ